MPAIEATVRPTTFAGYRAHVRVYINPALGCGHGRPPRFDATLALQAGVPAKVVSERLGHATVAFTLDVYSHVIPALQEDAAERIAALVDVSEPNVSGV